MDSTGLERKVAKAWPDLTKAVDDALAKTKPRSMRGVAQDTSVGADTVAVPTWQSPTWLASTAGVPPQGRIPVGIPLVELVVETEVMDSVELLLGESDGLAISAATALDRLAVDGLAVPLGGLGPEAEGRAFVGFEDPAAASRGGTISRDLVPPVVPRQAAASLAAAIEQVPGDGLVVLHRGELTEQDGKDIAAEIGVQQPVRCEALPTSRPFALVNPSRVQLVVAEEWALTYTADPSTPSQGSLALTFVGTFRARADAARAFTDIKP